MLTSLYDYCIENGRTELLDEWDVSGNLPLRPCDVSMGSTARIKWRCRKGHEWPAIIYSRAEKVSADVQYVPRKSEKERTGIIRILFLKKRL